MKKFWVFVSTAGSKNECGAWSVRAGADTTRGLMLWCQPDVRVEHWLPDVDGWDYFVGLEAFSRRNAILELVNLCKRDKKVKLQWMMMNLDQIGNWTNMVHGIQITFECMSSNLWLCIHWRTKNKIILFIDQIITYIYLDYVCVCRSYVLFIH